MSIDLSRAEKLPREHRYLNISVLWIPWYRWMLRLLSVLRVPHEVVTGLSLICGLLSAYWFYQSSLLFAAIALHLKDIFDACDGALARLTGRGHLIGRYLDSLGDFLVLTAVLGAIGLRAAESSQIYYLWGASAIFATFIQCSFFNYYQLAYLERYGVDRLSSQRDERNRGDLERQFPGSVARVAVTVLHRLYLIIYGWQDRLVAAIDNHLRKRTPTASDSRWFGSRGFMIAQSALCFGTQIFVIIVAALIGRPQWALPFIGIGMTIYLALLLWLRPRLLAEEEGTAAPV
ncbi:MAG: CDP-alcohol phosphatidyltransferase family protein, partial [bacterium]